MANDENLIKNEDLTPKQRRENASKAGKASGKARAVKKSMKELALAILNAPITEKERKRAKELGLDLSIIDDTKKGLGYLSCLHQATVDGYSKGLERLLQIAGEHDPAPIFGTPEINLRPVVNVLMPGEKPPEEETAGDAGSGDSEDNA